VAWVLAAEIVSVTLCAIHFIGGKSWLRHFAFSVCFIFASIPWFATVEGFVIQGLARVATIVTVAMLNLFRIAAVQHGNIIEVKTGLLGVDEACSG
jgi:hypothetical protein